MSEPAIQNVSDTAFMVAVYRAMETERPDALFRDPLARRLAGERGKAIVASVERHAFFGRWFVVIRTHVIDAMLKAAVAEGVDMVLNLGAGLDTRPYRMDLPATLQWVEVDFPHMIDFKAERLRDEAPRCRLERIKLDLADAEARQALFAGLAKRATKALVLTEGVIPYLTTQAVGDLADALHAEPAFQYWIADYLSPSARKYRKRMEQKMKMQNAPFRFEPEDYFGFFRAHGWEAKEIRYIPQEADRLKRPLALPFIWRALMLVRAMLSGASRRESFRTSVGYVLFTRG